MLVNILIFMVSLGAILWASEALIEHAARLGAQFGWPSYVIGFVIIGLGTSAPEIAVSLYSAFTGQAHVLLGNIAGSHITNCLLVLGVGLLFAGCHGSLTVSKLNAFALFVMTGLFILGLAVGHFAQWFSALCLVAGCGLIIAIIRSDKTSESERTPFIWLACIKELVWVILLLALVVLSARYIVVVGLQLAQSFGLDTELFAMSFIAIGTSLPEVVLAISAARRRQAGLLIGNVVGSNVSNITFGIGLPGAFVPLSAPLLHPIGVMLGLVGSTLFCLALMLRPKLASRPMAIGMIVLFTVIYGVLFGLE